MKYPHVMSLVFNRPWAITPEMLAMIGEIAELRATGASLTREEIQARTGGVERRGVSYAYADGTIELAEAQDDLPSAPVPTPSKEGAVAVLPLFGVISQRANLMTEVSGGTSTEKFSAMFQRMAGDPSVKGIILDVDSPGGAIYGVEELASEIRSARGAKPIVAVANSLMASAAYWISSAADQVVATPGADVGSIGVIARHADLSKMDEMEGVKWTLVTYGKYKAEFTDTEPLGDEARDRLQAVVDQAGRKFDGAVAKNRAVPVGTVRSKFGQGRVFTADEALAAGMIDRIATLPQEIERMARGRGRSGGASAESSLIPVGIELVEAAGGEEVVILDDGGSGDDARARERERLLMGG